MLWFLSCHLKNYILKVMCLIQSQSHIHFSCSSVNVDQIGNQKELLTAQMSSGYARGRTWNRQAHSGWLAHPHMEVISYLA